MVIRTIKVKVIDSGDGYEYIHGFNDDHCKYYFKKWIIYRKFNDRNIELFLKLIMELLKEEVNKLDITEICKIRYTLFGCDEDHGDYYDKTDNVEKFCNDSESSLYQLLCDSLDGYNKCDKVPLKIEIYTTLL